MREQQHENHPHVLPKGVQEAERAAFSDIVDEAPAPENGINYGYYDIADHPIVTGEKPLHQKALTRVSQVGRAIIRQVSEANRSVGTQTWQSKQKDK